MLRPVSKGIENLLALATELERVAEIYTENGDRSGYSQRAYSHPCGSPACALGHYAAMRGMTLTYYADIDPKFSDFVNHAPKEFGISWHENFELFGATGCGNARTADEAAAYIRAFIARKIEALSP